MEQQKQQTKLLLNQLRTKWNLSTNDLIVMIDTSAVNIDEIINNYKKNSKKINTINKIYEILNKKFQEDSLPLIVRRQAPSYENYSMLQMISKKSYPDAFYQSKKIMLWQFIPDLAKQNLK